MIWLYERGDRVTRLVTRFDPACGEYVLEMEWSDGLPTIERFSDVVTFQSRIVTLEQQLVARNGSRPATPHSSSQRTGGNRKGNTPRKPPRAEHPGITQRPLPNRRVRLALDLPLHIRGRQHNLPPRFPVADDLGEEMILADPLEYQARGGSRRERVFGLACLLLLLKGQQLCRFFEPGHDLRQLVSTPGMLSKRWTRRCEVSQVRKIIVVP